MGVSDLRLVSCVDHNTSEAYAMACGADDLLYSARCYHDLPSALADSHIVFGLSARPRTDKRSLHKSTELPAILRTIPSNQRITFVFGNESHGLDNASLSLCHQQIIIPSNAHYHSLNLAQAVQVLCYIYATYDDESDGCTSIVTDEDTPIASHAKHQALVMRLSTLLETSKYAKTQNPQLTMHKLQQVFLRAKLSDEEIDLFCGIFKFLSQPPNQNSQ